jgi:hypothetical protein
MRVWLDDVRAKPKDYHAHVLTAEYAIRMINKGLVTHISFDHDLGDDVKTGYDVAKHIEEMAYYNKMPRITWQIHSANPVGRENIKRAMDAADKYWDIHEKA